MDCLFCGKENTAGVTACAHCGAALNEPSAKRVGTVVGGRFTITQVLGEGGMGVVYEAEQVLGTTARKVAVKMLHPHLCADPSITARFHRECATIAHLEHPNTIRVFDFGQADDGALYIAMEYVRGVPLSDVIAGGPMSPERIARVMAQICAALTEAHQSGIVHRDLKPDNVLLSNRAGEEDFVKVLDFGIAHTQGTAPGEQKLTKQGMVLGTPPYMSPEQFTGQELDARSDVYSLGVMAYEMLTGALPFEANTPWEWASKHLTHDPNPLEVSPSAMHAPEGMRVAILSALAKSHTSRPMSARQFAADLAQAVAPAGPGSLPVPTPIASKTAPMPAPAGVPPTDPDQPQPSGTGSTRIADAPIQPPVPARPRTAPGVVSPVPIRSSEPPRRRGKGLLYALIVLGVLGGAFAVILVARDMRSGSFELAGRSVGTDSGGTAPALPEPPLGELLPVDPSKPASVEEEPAPPTPSRTPSGTKPSGTRPSTPKPRDPAPKTPPAAEEPSKPPAPDSTQPSKPEVTSPGLGLPPIKLPRFPDIQIPGQPGTGTSPGGTRPQPTRPTPQPTRPRPTTPSDPCKACLTSARSGDLTKASVYYGMCSNAAQRNRCESTARTEAIRSAAAAAKAGNCSKAAEIARAARAMGASSNVLRRTAKNCK